MFFLSFPYSNKWETIYVLICSNPGDLGLKHAVLKKHFELIRAALCMAEGFSTWEAVGEVNIPTWSNPGISEMTMFQTTFAKACIYFCQNIVQFTHFDWLAAEELECSRLVRFWCMPQGLHIRKFESLGNFLGAQNFHILKVTNLGLLIPLCTARSLTALQTMPWYLFLNIHVFQCMKYLRIKAFFKCLNFKRNGK